MNARTGVVLSRVDVSTGYYPSSCRRIYAAGDRRCPVYSNVVLKCCVDVHNVLRPKMHQNFCSDLKRLCFILLELLVGVVVLRGTIYLHGRVLPAVE